MKKHLKCVVWNKIIRIREREECEGLKKDNSQIEKMKKIETADKNQFNKREKECCY